MADPLRKRIVSEFNRKLLAITAANGYPSNVGANGARWKTTPWDAAHLPGFNLMDRGVRFAPEVLNGHDWELDIEVQLALKPSPTLADDMITAESDVIACLGRDYRFRNIFPTGKQRQIELKLVETQFEVKQEDVQYGAVSMRFTLKYRTQIWDPTTAT